MCSCWHNNHVRMARRTPDVRQTTPTEPETQGLLLATDNTLCHWATDSNWRAQRGAELATIRHDDTPWARGTNGPASMQAWATGSGVERCDILLGSLGYLACIGYAPLV